ncbi:hypothetical protein [Deefgea salmonis]|uniref:Uncharacterized protein n=1 Tax=Deefgea salmonis TaxID=2875502 RepID=A0ABS8BP81_9NEIS|nr:hypothetical protein [Deefgea salmonis]MCB5197538.1 hypothetical protein [Deefgea salmonis]
MFQIKTLVAPLCYPAKNLKNPTQSRRVAEEKRGDFARFDAKSISERIVFGFSSHLCASALRNFCCDTVEAGRHWGLGKKIVVEMR